jgi:hypothetical protein
MQSGCRRTGNRLDSRWMPGGFEECKQTLAGNRGRAGIAEGMKVELRMRHHCGIEDHRDPMGLVIYDREWGHRTRLDAEKLAHQIGRAERKTATGAKKPVQRPQVDGRFLARNHKIRRTLLVAQEQVFGMPAGNRAPKIAPLLDRENRWMGHGPVRYAEIVQKGEKLVGRGWHRGVNSARPLRLQSQALFGIALPMVRFGG